MIITIQLDTENPEDADLLKIFAQRIVGINQPLGEIDDYDTFWKRTSNRTREVLQAWARSTPETEKPQSIIEIAGMTGLDNNRVHATVANLGKWAKASPDLDFIDKTGTHTPLYHLHDNFRQFLLDADPDAPCTSPGARTTNLLHT